MASSTGKKVLIFGPGFIGWNVLELLVQEGYAVTGFVRRQKHADQLTASGAAQTVLGDLDDKALITKLVLDHDIVIHMASADHAPSVEAILDGVQQRADRGLHTIYIHTSGTSLIGEGTPGKDKTSRVFHDSVQAEVDSVKDTAPHRQIDLKITAAQKRLLPGKKAKFAIMIPPIIYGVNPSRKDRLSIQIPSLTRYALKHGFAAHVGENGDPVWCVVHVLDLARGYVALLHQLEKEPYGSAELENPYYFCEASGGEEGEVSWRDIAELIGKALHERGLVSDPKPRTMPPETYGDVFGNFTNEVVGLNARCRAERLRKLGWKPQEKGWKESFLEDELPVILSERTDWKTYGGYSAPVAS